MITIILITVLLISLGLNIAAYILIKTLLKKINTYEEWILDFKSDVIDTLEKMRAIDQQSTFKSSFISSDKGAFESDDQVGVVFQDIVDLIDKLNQKAQ